MRPVTHRRDPPVLGPRAGAGCDRTADLAGRHGAALRQEGAGERGSQAGRLFSRSGSATSFTRGGQCADRTTFRTPSDRSGTGSSWVAPNQTQGRVLGAASPSQVCASSWPVPCSPPPTQTDNAGPERGGAPVGAGLPVGGVLCGRGSVGRGRAPQLLPLPRSGNELQGPGTERHQMISVRCNFLMKRLPGSLQHLIRTECSLRLPWGKGSRLVLCAQAAGGGGVLRPHRVLHSCPPPLKGSQGARRCAKCSLCIISSQRPCKVHIMSPLPRRAK